MDNIFPMEDITKLTISPALGKKFCIRVEDTWYDVKLQAIEFNATEGVYLDFIDYHGFHICIPLNEFEDNFTYIGE